VEDDVEVGALVLMSSRSVELDRFLANFSMIKFLVLKIITWYSVFIKVLNQTLICPKICTTFETF